MRDAGARRCSTSSRGLRPSARCVTAARRRRRRRRSTCAAPAPPSVRRDAAPNAASSSSVIPPSGPTTTTIERDALEGEPTASDDVAASCSTTARSAPSTRATTSAVDAISVTSGSQERRDCLPASRAVARHFASDFAARSPRHTPTRARGGPRDDPVDADLGEHLDGELGPVALGDRLHDGHRRGRRGRDVDRRHRRGQRRLRGLGDDAGRRRAGAVDEHDLLADPGPAYDDSVPRLVALHDHGRAGGDAGHRPEEDGERHGSARVEGVAQPAEHRLVRASGCGRPATPRGAAPRARAAAPPGGRRGGPGSRRRSSRRCRRGPASGGGVRRARGASARCRTGCRA